MTTKDYSYSEAREIAKEYEQISGKKSRTMNMIAGALLNEECEWMIKEIDRLDAAKWYSELSKIQDEDNSHS